VVCPLVRLGLEETDDQTAATVSGTFVGAVRLGAALALTVGGDPDAWSERASQFAGLAA
jgi:hypothetical protein